jgi:hypothetical protein
MKKCVLQHVCVFAAGFLEIYQTGIEISNKFRNYIDDILLELQTGTYQTSRVA